MKLLNEKGVIVRSKEEIEMRQCEEGDSSIKKMRLTWQATASSQGIMGFTWAQKGLAAPVMSAAGRKDAADLA